MENKTITVTELINTYNSRTTDRLKDELLKSYIKNVKIGFAAKTAIADSVVNASLLKGKCIHMDSCKFYFIRILALIQTYTNIVFDDKNAWSEYDMLNDAGILEKIMEFIDKKELSEFETILNIKHDDAIMNHISEKELMLTMIKTMIPSFDNLGDVMANMDDEKMTQILEMAGSKSES